MLQRLFFSLCFLLIIFSVQSQEKEVNENNSDYQFLSEKEQVEPASTQQKKVYQYQPSWSFGGNLGLAFWNGGTDILIAPKAYYNVSPKFLTGFGLTYIYSSAEDSRSNKYSQNSFGPSLMVAVRPVPMFQLSAEYEGLQTNGSYRSSVDIGDYDYSYWNNALYLGASFVSRNVSFGVRYDLLYDTTRSVYSSAWSPVIGFYF